MKPKEVADQDKCDVLTVQNWCKAHGVKTKVVGMNIQYDLTDEEVQAFMNRDKRRGRRWHKDPPKGNG